MQAKRDEFPHGFSLGWVPKRQVNMKPVYNRNPIIHTVSKFELDSSRHMRQSETDYINVGGMNYEGHRFNRTKGVVEYGDLTHVYHPRPSEPFLRAVSSNPSRFRQRSSPVTQYAEDAIMNGERCPFRVGR